MIDDFFCHTHTHKKQTSKVSFVTSSLSLFYFITPIKDKRRKKTTKMSSSLSSFHFHFEEVVRKNNAGVYNINQNKNCDETITMITNALQEFRLIQPSFSKYYIPPSEFETTPLLFEEDTSSSQDDDEEEVEGQTTGFIYKQAIPLQLDEWKPSSDTMVSFILIFNLALAYQLKSTEVVVAAMDDGPETVKEHLLKSRSLYELAYQLMVNDTEEYTIEVSLVLSNNLGQVLLALEDHEKANECFWRLLSTVMYLKDCGMDEELLCGMDGFLRSTSHLVLRQATAAAA